jgi:hypothetical protein
MTPGRKRVESMKKPIPRVLCILLGVIFGVVTTTAIFAAIGVPIFGGSAKERPSSGKVDKAELTALAYSVLASIKDGDYLALSRAAHPEFGVVFSPYATISLSTNRCFQANQIAAFGSDANLYVWGINNGSGEPIEVTPAEYFSRFVFDRDYTAAPIIGVNRIVRRGNALENITEVFPGVLFVDFHIPGGDRDSADELNWSSLRLGFEEHEGKLHLVLILRSIWTV